MEMFCYQCQEALNNEGCVFSGICGKTLETSNLQDLLIYILKGVSYWATKARELNTEDLDVDLYVAEGLFVTITNVNFDEERIVEYINEALEKRNIIENKFKEAYKRKYGKIFNEEVPGAAIWTPQEKTKDEYLEKAEEIGILSEENEDIRSLKSFLLFGLKGVAAYTDHAYVLKNSNEDILAFIEKALAQSLRDDITAEELTNLVLETGKYAVNAMALLDEANTSRFGNPEITEVYTGTYEAPAILVSGHDLLDLYEILEQTKGTGIKVYTHGEMLPANAYPELKKYDHLVGNYGGSWWKQQQEFEEFGGAIVMTTNCIQKPRESYKDIIFTTGLVGWPEVTHIPNRKDDGHKDFSPVIKKALEIGPIKKREGKKITIGFAHEQTVKVADKIVEAVKTGKISKFYVMGGCDGRNKERNYYTNFAKELPQDTVILTAGCAKYRYNMLDLGDIDGIPRVIDAGQCNDSYSLVLTALKLKEAFGLNDINELPIEYNIAWYEQKAVAVLLALLYMGVKGIRLGPTLPAFLSPNVLETVAKTFDIKTI
ncbi:hydroxylamine reductase [Petrotoga sp. 9PWA.NaAc.5.4]|uniref:hydroxylamine reductase n=1 Tax=Petrotoga sp. 9PWA.NaAc.5.4 TaxID=1434328 RepID=UPI000CBD8775|nr:hydroxylamine reductase [Petrotoga sp. 9PWA.NaAc.5.4]PNR96615.1 hydroxylamine reductase [Petrotoga sp. 9PWA.NaAc.5.4]